MNCDGVSGLLSAYVDGELSAGDLLRVEQHLRRCHWCADEVDALRQTIALVASLEEVQVPMAFHAQLHDRLVALGPPMKAVRTAPARKAKHQDFRRWAAPAAAAAALVIGVSGLSRMVPLVPGTPVAFEAGTPTAQDVAKPASGGVTAQNNPVTEPVANSTKANNPVQNPVGSSEPKTTSQGNSDTTPPTTTDAAKPATTVGSTNPRSVVHTASASFLDNISEPTALPTQKQLAAYVVVESRDTALAGVLKANFAGGAVNETFDAASGIRRLQITVDAKSFAAALAFVESKTGVKPIDSSIELNTQLQAAFAELTRLEQQREGIEENLKNVTDQKTIAYGEQFLEKELKPKADLAKQNYQTYANQVANGTITVTLKPFKAQ